jgi:hydroxymethylbilane synthase
MVGGEVAVRYPSVRRLRIATRSSPLARLQAETVAARLTALARDRSIGPAGRLRPLRVELCFVDTTGDRRLDLPIAALGGSGAFVAEVTRVLLEGGADLAVHSAKDLPASPRDEQCCIGAFPVRSDPLDALVGSTLAGLAPGAVVATGSVRRRAQLAHVRPDLRFMELRGNIGTRLSRVPHGGAIVVASAALERLGLDAEIAEHLPVSTMLPQVGQGALAVECRTDDAEVRELLAAIDDDSVRRAVTAERAFLAALGGGCDLPVGALATLAPEGWIRLECLIASEDGAVVLRRHGSGRDPTALGRKLATELLSADGAPELGGRHLEREGRE